jgi:hypothetical protein
MVACKHSVVLVSTSFSSTEGSRVRLRQANPFFVEQARQKARGLLGAHAERRTEALELVRTPLNPGHVW